MRLPRRLHTVECDLRWCYEGTTTGILAHEGCKCLCHLLRALIRKVIRK